MTAKGKERYALQDEIIRHEASIEQPVAQDRLAELQRAALRKLVFAARTTGGVAGRDEGLCAACDEAEALLATCAAIPDARIIPEGSAVEQEQPVAPLDMVRLKSALEQSMVALDDWLNLYAPEFCDPGRVQEAQGRVLEYGTIGYIAHVQEINHAALNPKEESK